MLKRKWVCEFFFSVVFSHVDSGAIPCIAPVTTVRNRDKRVLEAGAAAGVRVSLRSII